MRETENGGRKALRLLLAAWLCLVAGSVLLIPQTLAVDANFASLLPLLGCACILLLDGRGRTQVPWNRRAALLSLLAAGVFLLMLPVSSLIHAPAGDMTELAGASVPCPALVRFWFRVPYVITVILSVCGCALWLFHRPERSGLPEAESAIPRFLPFAILACGSLLCMLSVYPCCLFYPDQAQVWEAVLARDWNDWHTIGYVLFVYLCTRPVRSAYMVVLVQTGMWLLVNAYVLDLFRRMGLPRRASLLYAVVLTLVFTPYVYLWMLLKDTVFSLCLLGFSASLIAVLQPEKCRGIDYWALALCGLGTCLFRHAGTVPVLAGGVTALAVLLKRRGTLKKHLRRTAAGLCSAVLAFTAVRSGVGFGLLHAKKSPGYVTFGTPISLMCALAAGGASFDPADEAVLTKVMPLTKWADCYDRYWVDTSARAYGKIGEDVNKITDQHLEWEILRMNAKYLVRYPKLYLTALLDYSTIVWEMTRPRFIEEWAPVVNMDAAKTDQYPVTFFSAFTLTNGYSAALYKNPLTRTFAWRGGVWTYALLLCVLALILRRRAGLIAGLIPPLTVAALLMLTVPCPDPRFILPILECGIFFTIYTAMLPKN